jgi:hypothetical protein
MRKLLIPVAVAVSALAVAAPASAQYYGGSGNGYDNGYNRGYDDDGDDDRDRGDGYGQYNRGNDVRGYGRYGGGWESNRLIAANRQRMARIHNEIEMAAARRLISPAEAARLHNRAARFDRELAMLARDGMTGQEGAMFDARADRLAQEIRARTSYGNRYGNGYGYGSGYNRW